MFIDKQLTRDLKSGKAYVITEDFSFLNEELSLMTEDLGAVFKSIQGPLLKPFVDYTDRKVNNKQGGSSWKNVSSLRMGYGQNSKFKELLFSNPTQIDKMVFENPKIGGVLVYYGETPIASYGKVFGQYSHSQGSKGWKGKFGGGVVPSNMTTDSTVIAMKKGDTIQRNFALLDFKALKELVNGDANVIAAGAKLLNSDSNSGGAAFKKFVGAMMDFSKRNNVPLSVKAITVDEQRLEKMKARVESREGAVAMYNPKFVERDIRENLLSKLQVYKKEKLISKSGGAINMADINDYLMKNTPKEFVAGEYRYILTKDSNIGNRILDRLQGKELNPNSIWGEPYFTYEMDNASSSLRDDNRHALYQKIKAETNNTSVFDSPEFDNFNKNTPKRIEVLVDFDVSSMQLKVTKVNIRSNDW